jgi:hypothetical protein
MAASPFRHLSAPESGRISAAELREAMSGSKASSRAGKYNAQRVKTEDGNFDSKMEYQRFLALRLLERAGQIQDLRRQIPFKLEAGGISISTYVADFVYQQDGYQVVEDSKGFKTPEYRLKRRLMKEILGITILETGRSKASPSKKKKGAP